MPNDMIMTCQKSPLRSSKAKTVADFLWNLNQTKLTPNTLQTIQRNLANLPPIFLPRAEKIFIGTFTSIPLEEVKQKLDTLHTHTNSLSNAQIRAALKQIVPEMLTPDEG